MKFKKREKRLLAGLAAFTYVSGASLFVLSRFVRVASAVGEQHHPLEYWARVLHTSLTYLVVLALGYLVKGHVLPGLASKSKRRVKSGLGMLAGLSVLPVTAILMLYSGENGWSSSVALFHSVLGLLTPLLVLIHLRSKLV